ncbi:hypothetical protein ACNKHO_10415 [Shigella flexneri]
MIVGVVILVTRATWRLHHHVSHARRRRDCAWVSFFTGEEAFAMQGAARQKMIVAFILMLEVIIFFGSARCQPHSTPSRFVTF